MILAALHDYYQRRCADADPARRLPAFGREWKEIGFLLELDAHGALRAITDLRQRVDKRLLGTPCLVPAGVKKTSGIAANLLWDNAEYVLALPDAKKLADAAAAGKEADYRQRLVQMRAAFLARIAQLPEPARQDQGVQAVLAFLATDTVAACQPFAALAEIMAGSALLSFRLVDEPTNALVCQRPAVVAAMAAADADDDADPAADGAANAANAANPAPHMCLVTGEDARPARVHTAIKGVWGAQSSGANLVSFNLDAFASYGHHQGDNAPVGRAAAFAYTTALNALLARDSAQRMQVGDASTVCWAQRPDPLEDDLAALLDGGDDPDAHTAQVRALYQSVHDGRFDGGRGDNRFFVLGLAPNAARLAVRFWHAAPLHDVARRLLQWFDDIDIVHAPFEPRWPSLYALLRAVAVQRKADNIPPRLGGDVMRSILTGAPYPAGWLNAAVQRCRAEQQVDRLRAAAIRACLNRMATARPMPPRGADHAATTAAVFTTTHREITPMLDPDNQTPAYRLGRLFATLEKIQEEANPDLNATIRERYYGAASSTPVAVFTTLLRLKNHHLPKLRPGRKVEFEKLITEIMSALSEFPAQLDLRGQGRFAIGYYHQRQALFAPRAADAGDTATEVTEKPAPATTD